MKAMLRVWNRNSKKQKYDREASVSAAERSQEEVTYKENQQNDVPRELPPVWMKKNTKTTSKHQ